MHPMPEKSEGHGSNSACGNSVEGAIWEVSSFHTDNRSKGCVYWETEVLILGGYAVS